MNCTYWIYAEKAFGICIHVLKWYNINPIPKYFGCQFVTKYQNDELYVKTIDAAFAKNVVIHLEIWKSEMKSPHEKPNHV